MLGHATRGRDTFCEDKRSPNRNEVSISKIYSSNPLYCSCFACSEPSCGIISRRCVNFIPTLDSVYYHLVNLLSSCSFEPGNPINGVVHNPHRHGHGPGGSSSGEAALIASGGSIIGVGSDLGGSIRVPAHFCGICGFKPTAERVRYAGDITTDCTMIVHFILE